MLDVPALSQRHAGATVYLDTNVFIHLLNQTPGLSGPCLQLLDACAQGEIRGVTGDLTLAELLVQPLRRNDARAVATVRELLIDDGAVTLLPHDRSCFERAAALRAQHGLKMPDALHLATALQAGAGCFVSNDPQLGRLDGLEFASLSG
jgi:predicted nucleic acid-binding protein